MHFENNSLMNHKQADVCAGWLATLRSEFPDKLFAARDNATKIIAVLGWRGGRNLNRNEGGFIALEPNRETRRARADKPAWRSCHT
ncbi:hypothetical protein J6590_006949 [Homalodisca vitripennis]|nr:hypothetical protein J6590_006949 [Homalodisca vitripennis]